MRDVFHPYSDAPNPGTKIACYSVNEILAEKTRAMYERQGRARDIYDIVNISRNFREDVNKDVAKLVLKKKFNFIGIQSSSVDLILSRLDFSQLNASWKDQLEHQVEVLPSAENFFNDLQSSLSWWMDEQPIEQKLNAISNEDSETTLPRSHFPLTTFQQPDKIGITNFSKHEDQIRYAARNRLCTEIECHGIKRIVEPYSMRRTKAGDHLLYVYELTNGLSTANNIRSYKVNEITDAKVMEESFNARFLVEL